MTDKLLVLVNAAKDVLKILERDDYARNAYENNFIAVLREAIKDAEQTTVTDSFDMETPVGAQIIKVSANNLRLQDMFDGNTIDEVIEALQQEKLALIKKHNPIDISFNVEYHYDYWDCEIIITRWENEAEIAARKLVMAKRLKAKTKTALETEENERKLLAKLTKKYGTPP